VKTYKTVIVEDEPLVAKDLQKLVLQADPSIEVVEVLNSLQSAISYFRSNPEPDLIFMDIQLSDGVSFDLFKSINLNCPVIFTTAYSEYAIRAFKVNSIDYLLKPINKPDLKNAIEKFKKADQQDHAGLADLKFLIAQLTLPSNTPIYKERFLVHSGKSLSVIDQSNIAYFIKDTLIYIVTNDKQQFVTDFQTMEEVDELLNPKNFFRANRQYIINLTSVESFKTDLYSKILLKLKSPLSITIDISREKAQAFKKWVQ
jgi:two-component system, LytTR family, response regulator